MQDPSPRSHHAANQHMHACCTIPAFAREKMCFATNESEVPRGQQLPDLTCRHYAEIGRRRAGIPLPLQRRIDIVGPAVARLYPKLPTRIDNVVVHEGREIETIHE